MSNIPDDWTRANIASIFTKGRKKELGSQRPVDLLSIPGKLLEQTIKESISKYLKEEKLITDSQPECVKKQIMPNQPDPL